MTEDDARNLLLVRAVEIEDRDEALLTREDRIQANAAGLAASSGQRDGKRADERFLAGRSGFAATRLTTRHPLAATVLRHSRWPAWLGWAVPLAALVLGLFTNEIGSGKRLNIIAFPLIGMFAWNLAVYLALAAQTVLAPFRRGRRRSDDGRAVREGWLARLAALGRRRIAGQDSLSRALARFAEDWGRASARIGRVRGAAILHLGAALFAVGVIAGMYLRGLGVEYRAGWESTFLGPAAVHGLVTTLLAPASALTGVPLPDVERIADLRWPGPIGGGENATPWIHLFAVTSAAIIVVPRLLLASLTALNAARLRRTFPVPGREDFYVRRLLRSVRGGASEVRVTPYAFTPGAEARRNLATLLERALGEGARVGFDAPVPYGGEEAWLAGASLAPATDHHLVLFNLSSTPEQENHGAFVADLARRLAEARHGTALGVVLDDSAYRQRLGTQAGAQERLDARLAAWRGVLAPRIPLMLDLHGETGGDAAVARRLEAALIADPELATVRS